MMVSFVLSFFPRDVLDEILKLIESVSEDFPSYFCSFKGDTVCDHKLLPYLSDFLRDERIERSLRIWLVNICLSLLFLGFKCLVFMFTSKSK